MHRKAALRQSRRNHTSETDMFPAERRHVRENRRCDNDALPIKFNKRLFLDER